MKQNICKVEKNSRLFQHYQLFYNNQRLDDDDDNIQITDIWPQNALQITMILKRNGHINRNVDRNININANNCGGEDDHESKIQESESDEKPDIDDLQMFLNSLNLAEYYDNFLQHGFNSLDDIKNLKNEIKESHLEKMKIVKIAHVLKLLQAIKLLH